MKKYIFTIISLLCFSVCRAQIKYDNHLLTRANSANFGSDAQSAGDVNGDGFIDLIVGERYANNSKGAIHVYHGSANGFPAQPSWSYYSNNNQSRLGFSASSAGDVNGDGYDDIIAGAYSWKEVGITSNGKVFVFLGSSTGLSQTPVWTKTGVGEVTMGWAVAGAGDVDNDGYDDVLFSAPLDDGYTAYQGGKAWLYYGNASGISTTFDLINGINAYTRLGKDLGSAGDVNGDGYADIIVGAEGHEPAGAPGSNHGEVRVYYGSANGIIGGSPDWTMVGPSGKYYGTKASSAGDLNGDGYDDIVFTGNKSFKIQLVVYGSASGLASSADWNIANTNYPHSETRLAERIGDINGDGFDDLITASAGEKAYVFFGSASGPDNTYDLVVDNSEGEVFRDDVNAATLGDVDGDGIDDFVIGFPNFSTFGVTDGAVGIYYGETADDLQSMSDWHAEANVTNANMGQEVANAGDVNGDGWDDLLVSAWLYSNGHINEGAAFLYYGSAQGPSATPDWSAEGGQHNAFFGYGLSTAGDVNNDGYADVVIGAMGYDHLMSNNGRIYVYYGSASGLSSTADVIINGDQAQARIGIDVADAGDVNNDGYDDVVVGAYLYDSALVDEGAVFVFHGSATGLSSVASTILTSGQSYAWFGKSVSTAGDIDGDGYDDIIVGAPKYDDGQSDEGRAYVFSGSVSGVLDSAVWILNGDEANALLGFDVSWSGDNNNDGYDDIVVGAYGMDGLALEGRVFGFHGSSTGLSTTPDFEAAAHGSLNALGKALAYAGDYNDDGYDDIIVGAESTNSLSGALLIYQGSAQGLDSIPVWTYEPNQAGAKMGFSVSYAGDVNGDGIADVVAGALAYDHGHVNEGGAFVYYGAGSLGSNRAPSDLTAIEAAKQSENAQQLRVYPNPSQGEFAVVSENEIRSIKLMSLNGGEVSFEAWEVEKGYRYTIRPKVMGPQLILVRVMGVDGKSRTVRQALR